jgi:drug/metabolite transporter (DMT)-like permease
LSAPAESRGLAWGLVGVAAFSLTLPATRAAVLALDPWFVALGRAAVAGLIAVPVLVLTRSRRPTADEWRSLALSSLGVVFGFPVLMTWALARVPAAHGAVVLAILPLATAAAAAWVAHERPSTGFWIAATAGSLAVVAFTLRTGGGAAHAADGALLAALACAALGYALGARAARTLGGWRAISWTLVLCLPVVLPVTALSAPHDLAAIPAQAWVGFLYVAIVSQYVGFFAWYRGLALGGIARVGQLQLLQPFLTIAASALWLGERIEPSLVAFAVIVVAIVAVGRRMPVAR